MPNKTILPSAAGPGFQQDLGPSRTWVPAGAVQVGLGEGEGKKDFQIK